jgi:hypothetical protein
MEDKLFSLCVQTFVARHLLLLSKHDAKSLVSSRHLCSDVNQQSSVLNITKQRKYFKSNYLIPSLVNSFLVKSFVGCIIC